MFTSQADGSLDSRYQDFHLPLNFQDGTFFELGVNPNVEVIKTPFTINNARGVRVNPGRYEFDEYFILVNSNTSAPVAMGARYSIGEFYDGYRRSYALGPSFRLSENFNTALNLQVQDVELSTGNYMTTLVTAGQLQLQHEDVPERCCSSTPTRTSGARTCGSTSSAAQRFLPGLQRAARRTIRRPDGPGNRRE